MSACAWCGEHIDDYPESREPESCGAPECNREVRDMARAEAEEAAERAREDDYERYRR